MKLLYNKRRGPGQPKIFETPEDLRNAILDYIEDVESKNKAKLYFINKTTGQEFEDENDAIASGEYFTEYRKVPTWDRIRPTYYGFCAWYGMGRHTINHYKNREGYDEVVAWFKNILQSDLEQILLNPMSRNVVGAKFVAINNYGWVDKTEVESKAVQQVTFIDDIPKD